MRKRYPSRHIPRQGGVEYFVCGPLPMMKAFEGALRALDVSVGDMSSERFNLV